MFCLPLAEAASADRFGGKAASLNRVLSLGLRVPATVVVGREGLRSFLEENHLEGQVQNYLDAFSTEDNEQVVARFDALRRAAEAASIPEPLGQELADASEKLLATAPFGLAVRSSAILEDTEKASFAGVYESYVGLLDPGEILRRVVSCWCSAWWSSSSRWCPPAVRVSCTRLTLPQAIHGVSCCMPPVAWRLT